MRHSIAWPCGVSARSGSIVSALAAGDPDLPVHEVEAGDHLGDRMLDLQPRVHLEEVERAVGVEQELDRAGVGVAGRFRAPPRPRRAMRRRRSGVHRQRRRLLDDFLVAPLDRALALDERDDGAVVVAEQLDLDVPRTGDPALEVDGRVAERGPGLGARGADRVEQRVGGFDHAHALAAAAGDRLDHQRIADAARPRA